MTDTATLLDWLAAFLLVSGAFFSLVAGVGLFVLPDLLARMHAAAKPQVLGLLLMLAGLGIVWRSWVWLPVLFLAWITQMVTAPVASHLVGRTGYRTKHARRELLHRDELAAVGRRRGGGAAQTSWSTRCAVDSDTLRIAAPAPRWPATFSSAATPAEMNAKDRASTRGSVSSAASSGALWPVTSRQPPATTREPTMPPTSVMPADRAFWTSVFMVRLPWSGISRAVAAAADDAGRAGPQPSPRWAPGRR